MCYDREGNFMGCYAPEYCNAAEEDLDPMTDEEKEEMPREEMMRLRYEGKDC